MVKVVCFLCAFLVLLTSNPCSSLADEHSLTEDAFVSVSRLIAGGNAMPPFLEDTALHTLEQYAYHPWLEFIKNHDSLQLFLILGIPLVSVSLL